MKVSLQTLKSYFQNSPRKIAIAIVLVHIFFLIVGVFSVHPLFEDWFDIAFFGVYAFPVFILGILEKIFSFILDSSLIVSIISVVYYSLFLLIIFFAKNTATKKFKITLLIFSVWFLLSLTIGLFSVINR